MNPRLLESLKKLKDQQVALENELKRLQDEMTKLQVDMPKKLIDDVQDGLKNYSIINGYWHLDDENLGIKAEARDGLPGKDGRDGRDGIDGLDGLPGDNGRDGKDGKDGLPGKDGRDGKDGKDGKDGVDGITPEFEVGEINSVSTFDPAKVELIKNENKYIINMDIPRGRPGRDGKDGSSGGGGGSSSGGKVDDVLVDGMSVVENKIADIDLTHRIAVVLQEIEAIKQMIARIEGDVLYIEYPEELPIDFEVNEKGELMYSDETNAINCVINENGEMEVRL